MAMFCASILGCDFIEFYSKDGGKKKLAGRQYRDLKSAYCTMADFLDEHVLYSFNNEGVEQGMRKRHFLDLFKYIRIGLHEIILKLGPQVEVTVQMVANAVQENWKDIYDLNDFRKKWETIQAERKARLGWSKEGKRGDDNSNDSESQPDPKRQKGGGKVPPKNSQQKTNIRDGEGNLPAPAITDCDIEYEGGQENNGQESEDKGHEKEGMEDDNSAPTESDGSGVDESTHGGDDDDDDGDGDGDGDDGAETESDDD